MRKFPSKLTTLAAACLLANVAYANGGTVQTTHRHFPMHPRTYIQGSGGQFGFFEGDMMAPLYGNEEGIFYIDAMGKYATNSSWLGSVGLGLRQVRGEHLWGAYVFGDRSESEYNKEFWVVNPGVELFTNAWDFHLNGYIPTGERERFDGIFFGGDLGIPTYVHFKGHKQFDNLFKRYEEVGPGVDGEVGYSLLHNKRTRIYLGGYYFDPDHAHDITGVEGGVEVPLDHHFSLILEDSYDDVEHNTARFTLRMTLGGIPKAQQATVRDRILDPIPRHLGTLNTGMGIPSQKTFVNTGVRALYRDNIWFFRPGGAPFKGGITPDDCTFENPCAGGEFTQGNIDGINGFAPGANFYFSPGSYTFTGSGVGIPSRIRLNNGQSMYGRTEDYRLAAFWGNAFPVFTSAGIRLNGNNTLEAFQILNDGNADIGIDIRNAQNVYINHMIVGSGIAGMDSSVGNPNGNFKTAIQMDNAQNVVITNSMLNAQDEQTTGTATATGIKAINNSQFKLSNSKIYVKANAVGNSGSTLRANAIGIDVENSQAWLSHNWVNVKANADNAGSAAALASTIGLKAESNNGGKTVVDSRGDDFNLRSNAETVGDIAYARYNRGIDARSSGAGSTTTVNSKGDNFTSTNTAKSFSADARFNAGIYAFSSNGGTTTVNSQGDCFSLNNTANANGTNGKAYASRDAGTGIFAYSGGAGSTTTVNSRGDSFSFNNTANANGTNGKAYANRNAGIDAYSYDGSTTRVNSRGDSFSFNNTANAANGNASANSNAGIDARSVDGTTTVNATGDTFNITADANGSTATASVFGVYALGSGARVNIFNNRFNLSAKQNGANGTIQNIDISGDAVIVAKDNKFHHKS